MKRAFFSIILLIAFVLNVYANMDSTKVKIDVVDITHTGLINAIKKNVLSDSICEKHKYTGNIIIARQYGHLYSYAYVGLFAKMNVKKRDINTQNNSVFTIIDNYPFFLNVIDGDPHKYYISKKKNYEITYYSYTDKKLVNNKIWIFLLLSDVEVLLMDTLSLNTEEKQSGQLPGEVVYGDAFDFRDGADEDVEYEYDGNGNMTADLNRGIKEITYDVNNRPLSVTFSTRPAEQRTKYLYDASGRKLRTTYQTSRFASLGYDDWGRVDTMKLDPGIYDHIETGVLRPLSLPGIGGAVERRDGDEVLPAENLLWNTDFTRDYCGDIIYKDGGVERILTDNGYAVPDSAGGYDYYYYVKDWQGNVRAVIDEANRRMELNNYYPYGMPMSSTASVQPYKYGGKELDRTNGLDMYDFHARQYDPAFPHFLSIDTNAENYPDISPYAYCYGNPINIIDPLGTDTVHVDFDGYQIDPIKQGGEDVMFVTSFPELVVTGSFPNSASDATINSTMIIIGGLVADDVTGVGIANDAAIPIVFTAGALVAGGQQIYEYFNPPEPVTTSYYSYKPAPKKLPAYPDATPVKNKAGRKRWRLGNGDTAEWDSLHGELEVYDRNGNHKGAFDPKNGKQLKPGKKNRKLKK